MNSLIEAMEYLQSHGLQPSRRTWSLGVTLEIPLGQPQDSDGILVYPNVVWLVAHRDGTWHLVERIQLRQQHRVFSVLADACSAVVERHARGRITQ